MHNDDAVVPWYDGWRPSRQAAVERARDIAESWHLHGVHKWIAYERETGEVVGRGGYAFNVLGVRAVVSCTARHNLRSRAVMERIARHALCG